MHVESVRIATHEQTSDCANSFGRSSVSFCFPKNKDKGMGTHRLYMTIDE